MTEEKLKKALIHLIPIALLIGIIAGLYVAKEEEVKELEAELDQTRELLYIANNDLRMLQFNLENIENEDEINE